MPPTLEERVDVIERRQGQILDMIETIAGQINRTLDIIEKLRARLWQ